MEYRARGSQMRFSYSKSGFGAAAQTLCLLILFEILTFALASAVFSVPLRRLLVPFVLYLAPCSVVVPLIFNARRYLDRPRQCAVWFAVAVSVFCLLVVIATIYSGIFLGLAPSNTSKDIPVIAVFGCTIAAITAYYNVLRLLTSKR